MNVLREFGVREKKGEIGIEIEVEGRRLPTEGVTSWLCERDGSLRGEAMEYVLRTPCTRDKVHRVVAHLNEALTNNSAEVEYSGRAGLHIHVNVQQLTMVQVMNMICLYLIYEQSLIEFCGDGRSGNLFCLQGKDAEYLVTSLRRAASTADWHSLASDRLRYGALNVRALSVYGSLEFRAMRSTTDTDVIEEWVRALLSLKDAALRYSDPQQIVESFSTQGAEAMFLGVFGEGTQIRFSHGQAMEGVRLAQHIAYSTDTWNTLSTYERLCQRAGVIDDRYEYCTRLSNMLASEENYYENDAGEVDSYVTHYVRWNESRARAAEVVETANTTATDFRAWRTEVITDLAD